MSSSFAKKRVYFFEKEGYKADMFVVLYGLTGEIGHRVRAHFADGGFRRMEKIYYSESEEDGKRVAADGFSDFFGHGDAHAVFAVEAIFHGVCDKSRVNGRASPVIKPFIVFVQCEYCCLFHKHRNPS